MNQPAPAFPLTDEQKFDALKMRYKDQVKLLRYMTTLDFKIFGGYITLQILLAAWLGTHPPAALLACIGIAAVDLALAIVAAVFLENDYKRRTEVAATLKNIAVALRFSEDDAYIAPGPLNVAGKIRAWRHWYRLGLFLALSGIILLLISALI
jgi:hypothetical protein